MISNLSAQSQKFLADVERVQERISQAAQQVSSGKRVEVASDAPDVISDLLRLRAALQRNTQITENLGVAQTDAGVADSTLSNAIQLMDRAVTLASQGLNVTVDAGTRQSLAAEVQSILEQTVAYSQTASGGRYIFSGDSETLPQYQLNPANAGGVDRLVTISATRQAENPAGGSFPVSETAQDIFDHRNVDDSLAPDNVFAALNGLRTALLTNNTAAITASINSIDQASDHLNSALAFYGTVENRIQDATNFAQSYGVQLQTQISQKEDADVVAASLELSQDNVHLQAAFQMQANIPRSTLFDYLGH